MGSIRLARHLPKPAVTYFSKGTSRLHVVTISDLLQRHCTAPFPFSYFYTIYQMAQMLFWTARCDTNKNKKQLINSNIHFYCTFLIWPDAMSIVSIAIVKKLGKSTLQKTTGRVSVLHPACSYIQRVMF